MTPLALNNAAEVRPFADLPEVWQAGDFSRFSPEKSLFDYQQSALTLATRALWLYYGEESRDWRAGESEEAKDIRKRNFAAQVYGGALRAFDAPEFTDRRGTRANPVFRILERGFAAENGAIPYWRRANRMGFWMATGSGKTLVMIKLAEHLERLKKRGEIPPHPILILAPGGHPLGQIRRAVGEFNRAGGLRIELAHLREFRGGSALPFNNIARVYLCDANHFSEEQKEAMVDYRAYENGGQWLVMLDEAHRGKREDAKRKAMCSLMARDGFLFNFSATFTDPDDIATAVVRHNLPDFVRAGHGKRLRMHKAEFDAFHRTGAGAGADIGGADKKKITLKSLATLATLKRRVFSVREKSGLGDSFYHAPLMLTLVNSVNVESDRNDLFQFFQTLRDLASGEITAAELKSATDALAAEWRDKEGELFRDERDPPLCGDADPFEGLTVPALREAVFLGKKPGALEYQTGPGGGEIAFKLKSADAPFGLIRIGDIRQWTGALLDGMEEVGTLAEETFFSRLEESPMTMLMGSRAFFESWDSNRPSVINFINIGGRDAQIFVPQSVGRGARIEPLPGRRWRLDRLLPQLSGAEKESANRVCGEVAPLETLFLFATNRAAMEAVLAGMGGDDSAGEFRPLERLFKPRARKAGEGPLLVPCYKRSAGDEVPFLVSENSFARFRAHMGDCPDSVFLVRDGLSANQATRLRAAAEAEEGVEKSRSNHYADINLLRERLTAHFEAGGLGEAKVRKLNEGGGGQDGDIVHFRRISANLSADDFKLLRATIRAVADYPQKMREDSEMLRQVAKGEMTPEKYQSSRSTPLPMDSFRGLEVRHCARFYYAPLAMAVGGKAEFIRHIIREGSEVEFLRRLEKWLKTNLQTGWDFWMFSKLDETADSVYIPYYDRPRNMRRKFHPDFVFWMRRKGEYRIVFVDPHGATHLDWVDKRDGWEKLFRGRTFSHEEAENIRVRLMFYTGDRSRIPGESDRKCWIDNPADIFADD